MAFPPQFLEQIRQRVAVSDIVGRKVQLKRRGREFVGLSPFKEERTPSFTVNDDKQFYHCFSTGKHGDVFGFLMETEGLSFPEAVEQLARRAGLEMPARNPQAAKQWEQNKKLYALLAKTSEWFQAQLHSQSGKHARAWLATRKIGEAAQRAFALGYAPAARQALVSHLEAQGFDIALQEAAGVSLRYEESNTPQSRFFDRIIFPVHDTQKRVIGFGARALRADAQAKYINSPETAVFHKRAIVYNFAQARQPAFDSKQLLVVEGYMDVIALHQAGMRHVVAPLGTAIGEDQIALLWRLAPDPILCLDGDKAGQLAGFRVVERVLPILRAGQSLRFATLPDGKDPDDIVQQGGAAALAALLKTARPLVEMLWAKALAETPYETPEQKAQLRKTLRRYIASIRDRDIRQFYGQAIAGKWLDFFPEIPYSDDFSHSHAIAKSGAVLGEKTAARFSRTNRRPMAVSEALRRKQRRVTSGSTATEDIWPEREIVIMAGLLAHPKLLRAHRNEFEHCRLQNTELQTMCTELLVYADTLSASPDTAGMEAHLHAAGFGAAVKRLRQRSQTLGRRCAMPDTPFAQAESEWLETLRMHHHLYNLEIERQAAQQDIAANLESETAQKRLQSIKDDIAKLHNSAHWRDMN